MKSALAAVALAAAALASDAAVAQPHGGGHLGVWRGGPGRAYGGYHGYRGYGGYRGFGGPYWYGFYGWAPWGWYPYAPYYPDYDDDYVYPPPPPPPPPYYPPPPPRYVRPPPAPAPHAAATPKAFVVYFPFDRADLTPQAKEVIEDATHYAAQWPDARTTIVGYTDAAGSEGYNQSLSEQRSQAVREALVADGLRAGSVEMDWKGKHDQAVQTPDGVKEPANRRVTIVVRSASDPDDAQPDAGE
jgi:outer membrane protein OmpA-like peptidoglycan-associated protein